MGGLWDKVGEWVVKAFVGVLTTGGLGLGVFGVWFGRILFSAYSQALSLVFVNDTSISRDLYANWSQSVFVSQSAEHLGWKAGAYFLVLLLFVWHAIRKASLSDPARNGIERTYKKRYYSITIALFLLGLFFLGAINSPLTLLAVFGLIVVPAVLYLILYSRDISRGGASERFCYVCVFACFAASLFVLPHRYGERSFDLLLRPVTALGDSTDVSNVFVFDEKDSLLCHVTPAAGKFSLLFFKKSFSADELQVSIRDWVANYTAPEPVDTTKIIKSLRSKLDSLAHHEGGKGDD